VVDIDINDRHSLAIVGFEGVEGARSNGIENTESARFGAVKQPVVSSVMAGRSDDAKGISISVQQNTINRMGHSTGRAPGSLQGPWGEGSIAAIGVFDVRVLVLHYRSLDLRSEGNDVGLRGDSSLLDLLRQRVDKSNVLGGVHPAQHLDRGFRELVCDLDLVAGEGVRVEDQIHDSREAIRAFPIGLSPRRVLQAIFVVQDQRAQPRLHCEDRSSDVKTGEVQLWTVACEVERTTPGVVPHMKVRAAIGQDLDDTQMAVAGGDMRRGVAIDVDGIHGAPFQDEEVRDQVIAFAGNEVQTSLELVVDETHGGPVFD
jgi:hypothetical protein